MRQRLLSAGLDVFLEVGYGDARLEDIAKLAGFTTGAVYSNFGSKQGLFASLLAHHSLELGASTFRVVDRSDGSHESTREALAAHITEDARWNQLVTEFALQAARYDDVQAAFAHARQAQRSALAASMRERAQHMGYPDDMDYESAALALLVVIDGLALEHAADPDGASLGAIRAVLDLVLRTPWLASVAPVCDPDRSTVRASEHVAHRWDGLRSSEGPTRGSGVRTPRHPAGTTTTTGHEGDAR